MTKRKQREREQSRQGGEDRARPPQPPTDETHRLRGAESADDFADAEADSCTVIHHRDTEQSDS